MVSFVLFRTIMRVIEIVIVDTFHFPVIIIAKLDEVFHSEIIITFGVISIHGSIYKTCSECRNHICTKNITRFGVSCDEVYHLVGSCRPSCRRNVVIFHFYHFRGLYASDLHITRLNAVDKKQGCSAFCAFKRVRNQVEL